MKNIDLTVFNIDNEFTFNTTQIVNIKDVAAFSCRGAKFTSSTNYNYRGIPNGGGCFDVGDIIAENDTKYSVCTKKGYIPMQGSFKLCETDMNVNAISGTATLNVINRLIYNEESVYFVTKAGCVNGETFPNHKEGYAKWGDATLLFLCEVGKYETIVK